MSLSKKTFVDLVGHRKCRKKFNIFGQVNSYYKKWASSGAHLRSFCLAARLSLLGWIVVPPGLVWLPVVWWLQQQTNMNAMVGGALVGLGIVTAGVVLTGFRRWHRATSLVNVQVELQPGVLGLHIDKKIPGQYDLIDSIQNAVEIGQSLNLKRIQIESPLLVDPRQLRFALKAAAKALANGGFTNAKLVTISPRPMFFLRSALFTLARIVFRYDSPRGRSTNKERLKNRLPELSLFSTQTAGFRIELR